MPLDSSCRYPSSGSCSYSSRLMPACVCAMGFILPPSSGRDPLLQRRQLIVHMTETLLYVFPQADQLAVVIASERFHHVDAGVEIAHLLSHLIAQLRDVGTE